MSAPVGQLVGGGASVLLICDDILKYEYAMLTFQIC